MKKYRKAAALILGAVLTVTWGGSSLKAEEWSDGSEETVIWQEPETQEEGVFNRYIERTFYVSYCRTEIRYF